MNHSQCPAALAVQAAEAVRAINHTTRAPGAGWQYPGDAYGLIGALSHLSRMLPQAITQALQPVTDAHQDDRLTVDGGKDPGQAASSAVQTARVAIRRAQHLAAALDQVHAALGPLGYALKVGETCCDICPDFADGDDPDAHPDPHCCGCGAPGATAGGDCVCE